MMRSVERLRRHPQFERLSEFADGTLDPAIRARVAEHLEDCVRCLNAVATIREMDEGLRAVPTPGMTSDLFARIEARRKGDVRTLVPSGPVHAPRRRSHRSIAAAAVALIAVSLVAVVMTSREVEAGASVLRIELPTGESHRFPASYRAGSELGGQVSVRARARVWSSEPFSTAYTIDAGVLGRTGDTFEGTLELPADAAFALIALEDRVGRRIDPNGGGFWEIFPDPALSSEARAAGRLSATGDLAREGLLKASRLRAEAIRASEAFPSSVQLSVERATWELRLATGLAERTEILRTHGQRLDALMAIVRAGPAESEYLATLADYAGVLERPEIETEIIETLAASQPDHQSVVRYRVIQVFTAAWGGDEEAFSRSLAEVERLSSVTGTASPEVIQMGYELARQAGQPDLLLLWADRYASVGPLTADEAAIQLSTSSDLRREGIDRLRSRIRYYRRAPEDFRALHETRDEFEAEIRARRAQLRAHLGHALIAEGERLEALTAYRQSIAEGWDPAVAVAVIEAAEAEGVSNEETERLSRFISADPLYEGRLPDGAQLTEVERLAAMDELRTQLEQNAETGENPIATFRSRVGADVPIDDGGVTLIALWQGVPPLESEAAIEMIQETPRLARAGVRTLIAAPEAWLDETLEIAELAGARAVVDVDGAATDGFGGWHLREYVVVHDGWFTVHHDLDEATRLALLHSEIR